MRSVPSWRALSFLPHVTACLDSAYLAREMCDMISAMGMVPRIKPSSAQRQGKLVVARDGRLVHGRQGDVRLRVPPVQRHGIGLCRAQEDVRGLHTESFHGTLKLEHARAHEFAKFQDAEAVPVRVFADCNDYRMHLARGYVRLPQRGCPQSGGWEEVRNEIIRKKMQKTVLKQVVQISTMQIVGVRIVMCATLQSLFVAAHAPDLFKPAQ